MTAIERVAHVRRAEELIAAVEEEAQKNPRNRIAYRDALWATANTNLALAHLALAEALRKNR